LFYKKRLPLLFQDFIQANWEKDSYRVFGLSSQGLKIGVTKEAKDREVFG